MRGAAGRAISSLSGPHEFNANGVMLWSGRWPGEAHHAIGPVLDVLQAQEIRNPNLPFALEHDPEKSLPGLDPGWEPVFGKRSCSNKKLDHDPDDPDST